MIRYYATLFQGQVDAQAEVSNNPDPAAAKALEQAAVAAEAAEAASSSSSAAAAATAAEDERIRLLALVAKEERMLKELKQELDPKRKKQDTEENLYDLNDAQSRYVV